MLSESDVRKALKETLKSDKPEAWAADFAFLEEGAIDSLDHVTFVLRLAEHYGLDVPDQDVHKLTSIRAVVEYAAAARK